MAVLAVPPPGLRRRVPLGNSPPQYEMYAKMVVTGRGDKTYESITGWDRAMYAECGKLILQMPNTAVLPTERLTPGNNTSQALNWNFREWRHFFNARQLYSLSLIATAIRDLDCTGPNVASLPDAGVEVGRGDVRSVIRGTLLAHLAANGYDLDQETTETVDRLATLATESLAKGNVAVKRARESGGGTEMVDGNVLQPTLFC